MARFENRIVIKEQAVNRHDVMISPFSFFIHETFQAKRWLSFFTSNNVYHHLVCELYANMEVVDISQSCPILKTIVLDVDIRVDDALISVIT